MTITRGGIALGFAGGVAFLMAGAPTAQAQQQFITIGTGGVTGVYYPLGGAICRLVNQGRNEHGIRCSAESTEGSVFNLNSVRQGELDFGIVQSDVQHDAYEGLDRFEAEGPFEDLRALFSLHPEPFTVVVRPDAGIEAFEDLRGKRVNIGNPGSGQRAVVDRLMEELGWTTDDFSLASELPSREQAAALCDNRIDAFLFTVGHPSGAVQEPIATCDAQIIPVEGETIDQLAEETPYYFHATIPGGMYPNHPDDIETFAVGATFVTRADTPDEVVYEVTKAVFENFDTFTGLHPAFAVLEQETMVEAGLTAPLHEGAERYFEEAGLK